MGSMWRAFLWFYTAATVLSVSRIQTQRSLCAVILHSGSLAVVWLHAALQTEPRSAPFTLAPTLTRTCEAVRAFLEQWLLEAPHHWGPRPLLLSCSTLTRECWPLNTVNWPLSHTGTCSLKQIKENAFKSFLKNAFNFCGAWIFSGHICFLHSALGVSYNDTSCLFSFFFFFLETSNILDQKCIKYITCMQNHHTPPQILFDAFAFFHCFVLHL